MVENPKPRLRRRRIIERPRLIRALDRSRARVRMLVAGAGYGKTTLAEQWAAQRSQVAWVRARRSSADVAVLARQVAAAGAEILSGADRRVIERLKATTDPAGELAVLVDLLSEDLAAWPDDAWIVIDDYHHLKESVDGGGVRRGDRPAVASPGPDLDARAARLGVDAKRPLWRRA